MGKILFLVLVLFSGIANAQSLEDILWISEDYPPSNFVDKDGVLRGFTIDILLEMWKKVGLNRTKQDITIYPWARGINKLGSDKNICLFGISISEERKKLFKFVGGAPGNRIVLFAKKEKNYRFNSIEEVNQKFGNQEIGVVRDDIGEQVYLNIGGKPELLHRVTKADHLINMTELDRLELFAYADTVAFKKMSILKIPADKYEIVFQMYQAKWGYGFNKNVNPEVLKKLQKAFDELVADGTVMRIYNAYVNNNGSSQ